MWTNDPFWLFMLKGLIERARPILNWVCSLWILGVSVASFMTISILGGMENAMNPGIRGDDTVLILLGIVGSAPLWSPAALILILMNVKFSIGWRQ